MQICTVIVTGYKSSVQVPEQDSENDVKATFSDSLCAGVHVSHCSRPG